MLPDGVAAAYREETQRLMRTRLRITCVLTTVLYLSFVAVDAIVYPDRVVPFLLANRLPVVGLHLAILALSATPFGARHARTLSVIVYATIGIAVAALVHQSGEPAVSPYYAGMMVVVLGFGLLMPWSVPVAALTATIIYAAWLVPLFTHDLDTRQWHYLFPNHAFFLSTAIVAVTATWAQGRLRLRAFVDRWQTERANALLEERDRYKTRFFANITHELRTPLTLILAPVDAILSGHLGQFSPSQEEYFRGIRRNALKLLKLINDLLDLAKLEESRLELAARRLDAARFLAGIVDVVRPLAERKDLAVTLTVHEEPPDLWADPDHFERVVINLLSNAVKFTPPGGRVEVTLDVVDGAAELSVSDNGIGVPADRIHTIFDRFTQTDDSVKRRRGGTGIGLALVKEVAELHGGSIAVASEEGVGTTFRLRLPQGTAHLPADAIVPDAAAPPADASATDGAGAAADGGSAPDAAVDGDSLHEWTAQIVGGEAYRYLDIREDTERRAVPRSADDHLRQHAVLVVDDNREMLEFLHIQLREHFRVYAATDGARGWDVVQRHRPDVVVSDYMMPEVDGLELCALVKGDPDTRHIPVILLSAKADVDDRVRGHEAGADAYLGKPFRPQELLAVIRQQLSAQNAVADTLLEKRMQSLDIISAGLAHEIKNPLTYIQNALFVVERTVGKLPPPPEGDEAAAAERAQIDGTIGSMMELTRKGVQRIQAVVEVLREYAQEGLVGLERDHALDDAVRATLDVVAPKRTTKTVAVHPALGSNARVRLVPDHLHQVITNLVQNAIDAVEDGGNVWVTTSEEHGLAVLRVRDDGPGIAQERLRDIFSPFYTTKGPGEGMGLGLTIVHRFVQKAGGSIDVYSKPDAGTEFTVRLPLAPLDPAQPAASPSARPAG